MLCVVIDQFQTSAHLLSATVRNGNLAYRISAPSFARVALSSLSGCMIEEERDADKLSLAGAEVGYDASWKADALGYGSRS